MEESPKIVASRTLTPDDLIHGAWYALEQCGLLLNDAWILLQHARHATAASIAMIAREELGRYEMLLDFWRETVVNGIHPSVNEVRSKLERQRGVHLEKQRRGGGTLIYRGDGDSDDEVAVI